MLPKSRNLCSFFDLLDYKLHVISLPEASNRRRRCGSSHGWLIIVEESPLIFIINPLTKVKVNLPPLSQFPNVVNFDFYSVGREFSSRFPDGEVRTFNFKEMRDCFIKKVILSHSPSLDPKFIAVAILNETSELAYCKYSCENENTWKLIVEARFYTEDVIYFDKLFYAVNKFGEIAVCDVNGDSPRVSFIETPIILAGRGDMQYLVKTENELLLVTRFLELDWEAVYHLDIVYKTVKFRVSRLDLEGPRWEELKSLDEKLFFLGENSAGIAAF